MKLGLSLWEYEVEGGAGALRGQIADAVRIADEGGFAQVTLTDHFFQMPQWGDASSPVLEGYTTLAYIAGITERVNLGLMVTGVTYRHPGVLAHTIATLDVLSGGRAQLGIGTAWYEREHLGLGVPFPPMSERYERMGEAVEICKQMWSDDDGPYQGKHYQLTETLCRPRPLRRPPVLIGGNGERKTLPLVARLADMNNFFVESPEQCAHLQDVLRRLCDEIGRDPAEIKTTLASQINPHLDPDGFLQEAEQFAKLGVDLVTVSAATPSLPTSVEGLVPLVKALSEM